MRAAGKRLLNELAVTGGASVFIAILLLAGAPWVLFMFAMPLNDLGIKIGAWVESALPHRGAWFQGARTYAPGVLALAWLELWVVSFLFVRLIRMQMSRREKREAQDSVSLKLE